MLAREGVHTGFEQYARSKRTPAVASPSSLGVRMCGFVQPSVS